MAPASTLAAPVRLIAAVLFLLSTFALAASSTADAATLTVFAWPLGEGKAQPQPLAKVSYDAANASAALLSWSPPTSPSDLSTLVRIGLSSDSSSSILTSAAALTPYYKKTLVLHAAPNGDDIFTVGLGAVPRTNEADEEVDVRVEHVKKGPAPVLNKPVVLDESGKVAGQEVPEKTFLQKYWWAIALFLVLQVVAGGGKE
ncbi:uncharacterized protein J3D65DRAFT_660509 [Phyllosticta citribraziliensis]|uniref:Uncharacterized protein n=1 Tax=Phyllosticta citribraziliensis TaxID=989973 RepID=A0ABR1LK28_9PEZI